MLAKDRIICFVFKSALSITPLMTDVKNKSIALFLCMHFSSKLIEQAVDQFAKLPGVGRKSALRLTLHLLRWINRKFTILDNRLSI